MTLSGKQPFGNERFHAPQITVAARKESVASNIRVANSQAYRFQALPIQAIERRAIEAYVGGSQDFL
jgi:hypothetical protein